MKAVILAAGKSTRTYPLTLTRPKALLTVANKTILEHNLDQLSGIVKEVILVIGYGGFMIKAKFGRKYKKLKLTYVEQKQQLGTGHALKQAEKKLKGRFIVINGDDLFFKQDMRKCKKHEYCVLVQKVEDASSFGSVDAEKNILKCIKEKSKTSKSKLVNTGLYVMDHSALKIKAVKSKRGEFEITDIINKLAQKKKVRIETTDKWIPIVYPWDLLKANSILLSGIKKKISGKKEKHVIIKGKVSIGKGTVIKSNTYIEGPVAIGSKCVIGPNAYIRGATSIGDNCKIGHEVEIKNSIIMSYTNVPHLSYVGDSVLGQDVNFAAGSITANFRHDAGLIRSSVKKELVPTGRNKLGTIIGDGVKLGIKTVIYPGRKIWPNKSTKPGETVTKDIE